MKTISVIGAGLAGSEAAWQIAQKGIEVHLYEMRPHVSTPAHETEDFAELVCSNSLGSSLETVAGGVLKKELELFDSLIIEVAKSTSVPAGGALAVDRKLFSEKITDKILSHQLIKVIREECVEIPDGIVVLATGPLTSPALTEVLQRLTASSNLYFYDAAAPIVTGESIDYDKGFWAARYDRG